MERAELARCLGAEPAGGASRPPPVRIATADPAEFQRAFALAVAGGGDVFLFDPGWTDERRRQAEALAGMMAGDADAAARSAEHGWLMIASGGTTGGLKFARHDQDTVAAAVNGFLAHFALARVNAVSVLPLYHVSGFMAWMRCAVSGGVFRPWDWKRLEAGDVPALAGDDWVISLVPTQLQRLLSQRAVVAWLHRFRVIFVGGGPVWPELAAAAAQAGLPIALSYGLTETAAMVTALRPAEFLGGLRSAGTALPHARVTTSAAGEVQVEGASLFRGYWPDRRPAECFVTGDVGEIDARGHLHVRGRADAMIITGGRKVDPGEVEAALRASGEFDDVAVLGLPDAEWGEVVVACYPARPGGPVPDPASAAAQLQPFQRPKRLIPIATWPRSAQGKLDRAELRRQVSASW